MKDFVAPAIVSLLVAVAPVGAKEPCPDAVQAAVKKARPGMKIRSCKLETVEGKTQYEVSLKGLQLDVSPDGALLLTEEKIAPAEVPAAVRAAFKARYPGIKMTAAEKQTKTGGASTYELAFKAGDKKKEATFDAAGAFVSEE